MHIPCKFWSGLCSGQFRRSGCFFSFLFLFLLVSGGGNNFVYQSTSPTALCNATFTLPTWFLSPRYLNYTTGAPPFWPATGVPSPVGLLYFTRTCAWRGARALCGWTRNCALQWVQPPAVHAHCCTPAHMSAVLRHNSCSQHDNSHSHPLVASPLATSPPHLLTSVCLSLSHRLSFL